MRKIGVLTKNSCVRAVVLKTVREVCKKCYAQFDGTILVVKGECTDDDFKELQAQLYDVVSPRLLVFGY